MDLARLARLGRVVLGLALVALLIAALARSLDELREVDLHLSPGWLAAAAPLTLAGGVLLPQAWREVLAAYGHPMRPATALRVWCVSQAARFVPGSVAFVASRIVLTARQGVPTAVAAASLAVEMGLLALWCAFYGSWLRSDELAGALRLVLAIGAGAALLAVPNVLVVVGDRFRRLPVLAVPRVRVYRAVALYGVNNLVRSAAFFFVAAALQPVRADDLLLVIAATNLGALAGMVGLTPAGIGVREGALVALLGPRFGVGDAAALAVAFRAWELAFELVWLAIAQVWDRARPGEAMSHA